MSVSWKLRVAIASAAVIATVISTSHAAVAGTTDQSLPSPGAIVGTGSPDAESNLNAIVGTGSPNARVSPNAIVGTGVPGDEFLPHAIVGTGILGSSSAPSPTAIVGTGAPSAVESGGLPSPAAIVGTGVLGIDSQDTGIQAIVGTGTPNPNAIVGTGTPLSEVGMEQELARLGCPIITPMLLGQIEFMTGPSDFQVLGQRVRASTPTTLANGDYVVLSGVVLDSGVLYADRLETCEAQYVPGASPVIVTGVMGSTNSSTVEIGGARLDISSTLSSHPVLSLHAGDVVSIYGTQPVFGGLVIGSVLMGY